MELHAASGGSSVEEEEGGGDKAAGAAGLLGLVAGAVDVPVSMGMSSKLAVHTGPKKRLRIINKNNNMQHHSYVHKTVISKTSYTSQT